MQAILSGMNVDMEILKKYHILVQYARDGIHTPEDLYQIALQLPEFFPTPETISAAAAKTSRSEDDLPTLRANAIKDIEAARKTNQNVVFGLGHESVAEHAYFNFDLVDVSRAVVNWVEEQRLASFTEKSMRYVKFGKDFLVPDEIQNSKYHKQFIDMMNKDFELYTKTYDLILPILISEPENLKLVEQMKSDPDKSKRIMAKNKLEGMAKEDARYCLPYATQTQLELSLNGRSLERMIRILNSAPLAEAVDLGKQLLVAQQYAPSLIKYPEKTKYLSETRQGLEVFVSGLQKKLEKAGEQKTFPYAGASTISNSPKLIDYDRKGDDRIVLALLTANSDKPYSYWEQKLPAITPETKNNLIKKALTDIQKHDSVFREFEFLDFTFEALLSEAAYAQLKRQRIMTLIKQPETEDLGYVIPLNVAKAGQTEAYKDSYYESREFFNKLVPKVGRHVALYALPLSNITRTYFKANLRELHSMARHREDCFAQWEIRNMQTKAGDIVRDLCPLSTQLLCGKDKFEGKYKNLYPCE
jgi:flavin-dependent thymidylate synthase